MGGEAWWATVRGAAQSQTEASTHRGIHSRLLFIEQLLCGKNDFGC